MTASLQTEPMRDTGSSGKPAPTRSAPSGITTLAPTRSTPGARRQRGPGERRRSPAVQRAYARRAHRRGRVAKATAKPTSRTPFVVLVMALLGSGLVITLWLSTAAVADSYHLEVARTQTRDLAERAEQLRREVSALEAAPELARRAAGLGLVSAGDPARLVVQPDGGVAVVGEPDPVAPAPLPATLPAEPAPGPPAPGPPAPGPPAPAPAPDPVGPDAAALGAGR